MKERCKGCGQPIDQDPDRGCYTLFEPEVYWHYDCYHSARPTLEELEIRAEQLTVKGRELIAEIRATSDRNRK